MRGGFDLAQLSAAVDRHRQVARVVVADFKGSTPRETGAAMLVWRDGQSGTIGGGALELEATTRARDLLGEAGPWGRRLDRLPLGPALAQCCGGAVTLLIERYSPDEIDALAALGTPSFIRPVASGLPPDGPGLDPARLARAVRSGTLPLGGLVDGIMVEPWSVPRLPVWLYGAGHVGRAIVHAAEGLPLEITWIDTGPGRFPDPVPAHVTRLVAADPVRVVCHAPDAAAHLVLTYSHALDLGICHAVLGRPFHHLGLIGSASKRARFLKRLRDLGHDDGSLARLVCPIGDRSLGKEPAAIALGVLSDLLRLSQAAATREARRA